MLDTGGHFIAYLEGLSPKIIKLDVFSYLPETERWEKYWEILKITVRYTVLEAHFQPIKFFTLELQESYYRVYVMLRTENVTIKEILGIFQMIIGRCRKDKLFTVHFDFISLKNNPKFVSG